MSPLLALSGQSDRAPVCPVLESNCASGGSQVVEANVTIYGDGLSNALRILTMPTYLMLVNFTDQGVRGVKEVPNRQDKSRETAKKFGVERKQLLAPTTLFTFMKRRMMRRWLSL